MGQAVNLWDRIERWRAATKAISADGAERPLEWEGKDILRLCADDLEADLRELRELAVTWKAESKRVKELADKERSKSGRESLMAQSVRFWMCADELEEKLGAARCALEARIG